MWRSLPTGGLFLALSLLSGELAGQIPTSPIDAAICPHGRVAAIEIDNGPVFESSPSQPGILRTVQTAANFVHLRTRESVILEDVFLRPGDCLDPFRVAESERVLMGRRYLASAQIEVQEGADGNHTLIVRTRDEWALEVRVRTSYEDGFNFEHLQFDQRNFLGRGIVTRGSHTRIQDDRSHHIQLIVPNVIGRMRVENYFREMPRGWWIFHGYVHPFSSEEDRVAWHQVFTGEVSEFSYLTGSPNGVTQIVVPYERRWHNSFAMYRFGRPGRHILVGASMVHHDVEYSEYPHAVVNGVVTDLKVLDIPGREAFDRQVQNERATRFSVHAAIRRYTFAQFVGLDSPRGRQGVPLGWYVGAGVGRGLEPGQGHLKLHANAGVRVGEGTVQALLDVESGIGGGFSDLMVESHVAGYLRHGALPGHTFFLLASAAGGWNTQQPFQLNLGGRHGVQSLPGFAYPGGSRVLFVAEDRITLPWPRTPIADFGVSLFTDAGRTWSSDAPFGDGADGWYGSVGGGLRVAIPSGSRNTIRADVVYPVGHTRPPIFRVAYEVYGVRSGLMPPGLQRSRWLGRGVEQH